MSNFYGTLKESCYEKVVAINSIWTNNIGNQICDPSLNKVETLFDAGDCCYDKSVNDTECKKSNIYCDSETIGDGKCHDNNNGPLCDYDLGDCCGPPRHMNRTECCRCDCHSEGNYDFWDDYLNVG